MKSLIAFLTKHDWLGHIVEAAIMAAIIALVFWNPVAGIFFAAGHFHGREKRDYEVFAKLKAPHLEAYKIWKWNKDQLTDFIPVALLALAVYFFVG